VAGGETLRSFCDVVGARALSVQGRLVPGVPQSVVQGGRWDGVTVVSKSGAFGHTSLLRELILERADP
jgi:D-threonate/D-erythronate kinase